MVYTIEQLRDLITPIAVKYNLPAVYLFGSYARGDATESSDIDFLVDKTGTAVCGLFALGGLYDDLCEAVEKPIDLLTTETLEQQSSAERIPWIVANLNREKVKVY